jgi:signal transduction histidine kinase
MAIKTTGSLTKTTKTYCIKMKTLFQKTFLLFVFIVNTFRADTQNINIDSLQKVLQTQKEDTSIINTLNALSIGLSLKGDYNNAMKYATQALTRAEKANFKKGKANAYYSIGAVYKVQFNYTEAFKNYFTALKIIKETGDKKSIAYTHLNIAGLYFNQGNYGEHLKNQYEALRLFEELGDKHGMATSLHGIGTVYLYMKNDTEALKYLQLSLKFREETGDRFGIAQSYNDIGQVYAHEGKFKKALENYFAAIKVFREPGAPDWGIPLSYNNIGNVYFKQGELANAAKDKATASILFSKAIESFLAASIAAEKAGNKKDVADAYVLLGKVNLKLEKFSAAREYLQKALELSKAVKDKEGIKESYYSLSNLDNLTGNYEQALLHYKKYILYRDSLMNDENTRKALQAKIQYGLYKEEVEELRKKNVQFFSIALLVFLVLVFLLIAFIQWRNSKQKQIANFLLKQQKEEIQATLTELKTTQAQLVQHEKMASLGEMTAGIAHEIQNPLNFVNNFSDLNSELIEELKNELQANNKHEAFSIADDIKENEQKINHHGKRADAIVKGMLQHSRASSGKKELTDINALADEYLRLSYHGLRAKDKDFNANFKTDFDESIGKIEVVPQEIGRALLNLYNNAFYSVSEKKKARTLKGENNEPTVWVTTKRVNHPPAGGATGLEISVRDNGNGIPQKVVGKIFQPFFTTKPTGQGTGLGLSLSYDIITKGHGGELKVETKEGEGAEFVIQLPIS